MWNYSGVCDVMFVNTSVIVKGTWLTQVELLKRTCCAHVVHTLSLVEQCGDMANDL